MSEFTIDQEFESLIQPLSDIEEAHLAASIEAIGCLEPLIIWTEERLLLDGHTRRRLCLELGRTWDVKYVSLPSRDAAIQWIYKHALARRNLSPEQAAILRGRIYNAVKQQRGGQLPKGIDQNEPPLSTAEKLAEEHSVSPAKIKRDGQLVEAIETAKETDPDIEEKFLAGEVTRSLEPRKPAFRQPAPDPKPVDIDEAVSNFLDKMATALIDRPDDRARLINQLRRLADELEAQ